MSQDWSQPSDRAAAAAAPFSDEQRTWLEDCLRRQLPSSSLSQSATTLVASVATTVVSQSSVAGEWTQPVMSYSVLPANSGVVVVAVLELLAGFLAMVCVTWVDWSVHCK